MRILVHVVLIIFYVYLYDGQQCMWQQIIFRAVSKWSESDGVLRQRLKEAVEKEQELVNSLQNMVVVVDEASENSSDDGNQLCMLHRHLSEVSFTQFKQIYIMPHVKKQIRGTESTFMYFWFTAKWPLFS